MSASPIIVFLSLAAYLFLPGLVILSLLKIHHDRYLFSYAISLGLITFTLLPLYWLGFSIKEGLLLYHLFILVLVVAAVVRQRSVFQRPLFLRQFTSSAIVSISIIFLVFSLHHFFVGPYTEIPSDFWRHLSRTRIILGELSSGIEWHLSATISVGIDSLNPIYFLHAIFSYVLDENPLTLVPAITLFSSLTFLGSIFWFSFRVTASTKLEKKYCIAVAVLATLITVIYFGTATFSYVRYYAYFPTIFNLPIFFASIAIVLNLSETEKNRELQLFLFIAFLATSLVVHTQEAVFIGVMVIGITSLKFFRYILGPMSIKAVAFSPVFIRGGLMFVGVILFVWYTLETQTMRSWGMTPHVVNARDFLPFLGDSPIANPWFRFWDTLAPFGALIFVWYLIKFRFFLRMDYINVGMFLPFFTHFNPLYAIVFLHYNSPTVLWRTSYLMPISLVAAFLIVTTFREISRHITFPKVALASSGFVVILLFLLPIRIGDFYNRWSRIPSLMSIERTAGSELWGDLIQEIDRIQSDIVIRRIITDSVTGFVLYSSTRDKILPWVEQYYFPKNNKKYKHDILSSDFTRHLLVINRRDGTATDNAKYSGHWSPDLLKTSSYYPNDIDDFIAAHPSHFISLWEKDRISIYLMKTFKE